LINWRCTGAWAFLKSGSGKKGQRQFFLLQEGVYLPSARSRLLPDLDPALMARCMGESRETQAARTLRATGGIGSAGDILSSDWNFVTNEVTPTSFNDFSFWSLVASNNGQVLANTFSTFVLSPTVFNEQTGFQATSFVLTSSGTFTLGFGVMDVNDEIVGSGLLIDSVKITSTVPEPASLALLGLGLAGLGFTRQRKRA